MDIFKQILDFLLGLFSSIVNPIIDILPDSPFTFIALPSDPDYANWISIVNWFFPVGVYLSMLEIWCSAIVVWYVYQAILRWAKVVE